MNPIPIIVIMILCAGGPKVSRNATVSGYYVEQYERHYIEHQYDIQRQNIIDGGLRGMLCGPRVKSAFIPDRLFDINNLDSLLLLTSRDTVRYLVGNQLNTGNTDMIIAGSLYTEENKRIKYENRITVVASLLNKALEFSPYYVVESNQDLYRIIHIEAQVDIVDYNTLSERYQKLLDIAIGRMTEVKQVMVMTDLICYDPFPVLPRLKRWWPSMHYTKEKK